MPVRFSFCVVLRRSVDTHSICQDVHSHSTQQRTGVVCASRAEESLRTGAHEARMEWDNIRMKGTIFGRQDTSKGLSHQSHKVVYNVSNTQIPLVAAWDRFRITKRHKNVLLFRENIFSRTKLSVFGRDFRQIQGFKKESHQVTTHIQHFYFIYHNSCSAMQQLWLDVLE